MHSVYSLEQYNLSPRTTKNDPWIQNRGRTKDSRFELIPPHKYTELFSPSKFHKVYLKKNLVPLIVYLFSRHVVKCTCPHVLQESSHWFYCNSSFFIVIPHFFIMPSNFRTGKCWRSSLVLKQLTSFRTDKIFLKDIGSYTSSFL